MKFKVFIVSVFFVCILLPGISLAQNKVVVIPLVDEKLVQNTYPCTGPDEVMSNGRCWKDRNLGASQVATSSTDAAAYGDLYQWGRLGDGHQNLTSSTTTTNSANDVPGHSDFITEGDSPYDWRAPRNDILWQGMGGVNNPCPQGFRLPTEAEWQTEMDSWNTQDAAGAFASTLKLVVAGYRIYYDGSRSSANAAGYYWSSTVSNDYAHAFGFYSGGGGMGNYYRANGLPVRCIKD